MLRVATLYALAATNWTAEDRLAAWRRELALAAPAYRRQLGRARPTSRQRHALRQDGARNHATVTRVQLQRRAGAQARVTVWVTERTSSGTGTLVGETRNRVRLQRRPDGRWRVSGWTAATDGSQG